jgi:branched-chain amino acid transport system substrate-binding protein
MHRKQGSVWAALLAAALQACLLGCQSTPGVPTVHVGLIAELSGDLPAVGASSRTAAELAVREVNEAGGLPIGDQKYQIELAIEDNASKADQSAAAAQKLASDSDIVAFVGPNASLGAIPAAEIAESAKLLMITPWSTNPKTTLDARTGKPKKYVFRACFTDPFEGRVLAKFALETLKAKKAAILYDQSSEAPKSQSELFRAIFTESGGTVVASESYTTGDKDFSAQLTKIAQSAPDIVFLPAYYNDVPLVVQQAKRVGLTAPFLGSDAWSSPDLIKLSDNAVEGFYFCNHYAPDVATPEAKRFIDAYTKANGRAPDDVAALTYDAFGLLFEALKGAGKVDRQATRDALSKIPTFTGVTGNMRFEEGSGDPIKSAVVLQIRGGKFVWVMNANP